ncbi:hypothetical protein DFH06DRAFT_1264957 [Mycena polygramma]|nr:hypothetical protein DFH06DRAFT_1264957 [Mycena polygramma]
MLKQRSCVLCFIDFSYATSQTVQVVILASYRFRSVLEGHMNGEEIWARSTALALKNMGYSYLYATTKRSFGELYRMFPQLVKIVIVDEDVSRDCFVDEQCIMSEENPYGVPAWKIFSFVFWLQPGNPLGHSWTLNPEDYQLEFSWNVPNTYLGYSVEPGCRSTPFIPHDRRPQPPQAWVLSKHLRYFEPGGHAWQADFYDDAANATGAQFVIGADGDSTPPEFPESLKNVGVMPQAKFYQTLANSAVLIGVGGPVKSPTPYDALCLGVPFINPILEWDVNDPTNRDQWNAQHGMLKDFDPPYVYHVFQGDKEGFLRAIKDALANPIQSYILDRMRMSAVEQRLGDIIERDWEAEARILLDKRKASGSEPLFTVRVTGT